MKNYAAIATIICSILILTMKDSMGFIHSLLHVIPNSYHHHSIAEQHTHTIDPLQIHKYLQHKHAHVHEEETGHIHTHDVMDHIHSKTSPDPKEKESDINFPFKTDLFVQHISSNEWMHAISILQSIIFFYSCSSGRSCNPPPYPPPQYFCLL